MPALNERVTLSAIYSTLSSWMIEYGKNKFVAPDGDLQTYFDNIRRYYIKSYHVSVIEYKKSQIFTKGIHIILNDDINLEK